jgi:hypothetical protein
MDQPQLWCEEQPQDRQGGLSPFSTYIKFTICRPSVIAASTQLQVLGQQWVVSSNRIDARMLLPDVNM